MHLQSKIDLSRRLPGKALPLKVFQVDTFKWVSLYGKKVGGNVAHSLSVLEKNEIDVTFRFLQLETKVKNCSL